MSLPCSLRLDDSGLSAYGIAVDISTAVMCGKAMGRVHLVVTADAPSSVCKDLIVALAEAGIVASEPRNARRRRRQSPETDPWLAKGATARIARERTLRADMAKVDKRFRTARRKVEREIAAISAGDTSAEQRDRAFRARRSLERIQQEMVAYDRDRAAELDREVSGVIDALRRAMNEDGPRARRAILDAELAANREALHAERVAREKTHGWMRSAAVPVPSGRPR